MIAGAFKVAHPPLDVVLLKRAVLPPALGMRRIPLRRIQRVLLSHHLSSLVRAFGFVAGHRSVVRRLAAARVARPPFVGPWSSKLAVTSRQSGAIAMPQA